MLDIILVALVFILSIAVGNLILTCKRDTKKPKKQIVAFIGRAGSGKDYQCKLLLKQGYEKLAFADALRTIAFSAIGIPVEIGMRQYNYLKENDCIIINTMIQSKTFTFRKFLELLGTQGIRRYDNDFWCRCLVNEIKRNNLSKICISDMRFLNEYNYISKFAQENDYEFKVVFCDFKSDRYQEHNDHESARLSNWFATHGYTDLQQLTETDIKKYEDNKEN